MRSRWYHPPTLHTGHHEERKVTWLELFFDLIFVAAAIQLGDALSEQVALTHSAAVPFVRFAGVFIPLWMAWAVFTMYANRYNVDDFTHRLLVFANMFSVGAMAVTGPFLDSDLASRLFSLALAANFTIVGLMNLRGWRVREDYSKYSGWWAATAGVLAAGWLIAAALPTPARFFVWGLTIALGIGSSFMRWYREFNERYALDLEHLSERFGLLIIIVLGESFVKVLSYINAHEYGTHADDLGYIARGAMVLLITCCIWWVYFDDVAGATLRKQRGAFNVWFLGHLPLAIGITAVGVGLKKFVSLDLDAAAPPEYRWLLAGALSLTFFSVAVIDSVTERGNAQLSERARVNLRFLSAGLVLILAQTGAYMSAAAFVGTLTAVCVGQVLFDIIMAPFEETQEDVLFEGSLDGALRRLSGEENPDARTSTTEARMFNPVRKAVPASFRRDLYGFFLDGSWTQLTFACVAVYLATNLVFAGLFLLEPGSISGNGSESFTHAFAFSVQTLTTIGYGSMTPATGYGDMLVGIEAFMGIVGVAVITGLVFAKASRPQPGTLFSNHLVTVPRHGVPTLMLRVANARGNEIIDATIRWFVLLDEITPEGHHMGRSHRLKLVSDHSPVFMFSWNVMHEIDEDSPLWGMSREDLGRAMRAMVVTLSGHDVTHGQVVSARKLYTVDDILWNHAFVDVLGATEDGRPVIDFSRFQQAEPLDGHPPASDAEPPAGEE